MAIKIHCTDCQKRISVDEAFAGGVCRCPYCKALVMVPEGDARESKIVRPDAPGSEPASEPKPVDEKNVPMANPVRLQSYIAIGAIIALLLLIVAVVILYVSRQKDNSGITPVGSTINIISESNNDFIN